MCGVSRKGLKGNGELIGMPHILPRRIKHFLSAVGFKETPQHMALTRVDFPVYENQCLFNCSNASNLYGWSIEYGWLVDDHCHNYVEAVFHAVCKIDNQLVDLSPQLGRKKYEVFVPDPNRKGKQISESEWSSWSNILLYDDGRLVPTKEIIIDKWRIPRDDEIWTD